MLIKTHEDAESNATSFYSKLLSLPSQSSHMVELTFRATGSLEQHMSHYELTF